jgi:hypothetical protein
VGANKKRRVKKEIKNQPDNDQDEIDLQDIEIPAKLNGFSKSE